MANITAKDVAALRERTGVGMMDCKKALLEADGDMEKAITVLREKGLAAAAKKAGRIAAEGVVLSIVDSSKNTGCVIEVNSETDFVAKNETFVEFVKQVGQTVIDQNPADVDALMECKVSGTDNTVADLLRDKILVIGENLKIRRFQRLEGILCPYVHGGGRIGVMVRLESDVAADNADLLLCGKDVAMQVAAANPLYLNEESVPESVLAEEKEIQKTQLSQDSKNAGKPEQVLEKILAGKIKKYFKEVCLVDQEFIKDPEQTVQQYVDGCAKKLGGSIKVVEFVRYERGEGLQKREDNFAEEVANMAKN